MSIDELRRKRAILKNNTDITLNNMQIIADESLRVVEVAHNSREILENLDSEFERLTELDKTDVKFLFFATALQIGRWIVINKINQFASEKIDNSRLKDNDASIKKMEREARDRYKEKHDGKWAHNKSDKYPTWLEIIYDGVPYDVSVGSPKFGVNMEAGYHRIHTLGHDPLLGWIFGTMNIISSTITLDDFRTYKVSAVPKPKHWEYQTNVFDGFRMAIESITEDDKRLPAAIFAEALHLKSDAFTKNGLPVPVLETFVPELASKLYKSNYDSLCLMKDVAVVGTQAVTSILINMIISLIHGLYYDPEKYSNRDLYEVKTRKILLYSNLIATSSNVIWVGGNAIAGNESALKDLDIGGLIVTMYRLVTDTKFIRSVKEEFVLGGFRNMIKGEELNLMEVESWD
ncbi:MAG: hypothetical protein K6G05_00040 [Lachnospiraceae bacterium]|nr:hypothetical protein [Lachnospiraceae bacterium]